MGAIDNIKQRIDNLRVISREIQGSPEFKERSQSIEEEIARQSKAKRSELNPVYRKPIRDLKPLSELYKNKNVHDHSHVN